MGGGATFVGDEVQISPVGFSRAELTEVSNVDPIGADFAGIEITDATAGELPDREREDVDGDGDVDRFDLNILMSHIRSRDASPEFDLNGDGSVNVADARFLTLRFTNPGGASAASGLSGATIAATPVLSLETATLSLPSGSALSLDLVISDLTGTLGGFALEVPYDPAAFELDGVSFSSALGSVDPLLGPAFDPASQTAMLAFDRGDAVQLLVLSLLDQTALAALQQSGSFTLATLNFRARAPIAAQFGLAELELVDGAQPPGAIVPDVQGVSVQVTCTADPDGDGICNDGDGDGIAGDQPCAGGAVTLCDDNCPALVNALQQNQDGDARGNGCDSCPFFATTTFVDTDGDGRGNACECTDQNADGRNTVADLVAINQAIFNPILVTPLCDGTGEGNCSVADIVAANQEIFSPTSTSICARQPVPGP
jgi:hypothetical protein